MKVENIDKLMHMDKSDSKPSGTILLKPPEFMDNVPNYEVRLKETSDSNSGSKKIIFTGDFCPGRRTTQLCRTGDFNLIFNDALHALKESDIAVVNLECPLTRTGNPIRKVGPHLKADPECGKALQYAGISVAALANNHILDYGPEGIRETLECLGNLNINTVGAGLTTEDAMRPCVMEAGKIKIALINVTENEFSVAKNGNGGAHGLDPLTCYYQIDNLKKEADCVIIVVHGGNEMYPLPSPRVVQLYRFFADLGVTAVIGHHTHCASGYEIYKGVPIFYSLGNFIFDWDSPGTDSWAHGFMVRLSLSGKAVSKVALFPYEQYKSGTGIRLLQGAERDSFIEKIGGYSSIILNDQNLRDHWKKFCNTKEKQYLSMLFGTNRIQRALIRRGIDLKFFFRRKQMLELLNRIRCEAHRDVSIEVLESIINRWE